MNDQPSEGALRAAKAIFAMIDPELYPDVVNRYARIIDEQTGHRECVEALEQAKRAIFDDSLEFKSLSASKAQAALSKHGRKGMFQAPVQMF